MNSVMKDQDFIKNLNEFELRCVTGNFKNYVFPKIFDSNQTHPIFTTLEKILNCILSHEYEKVLEAKPSDYLLQIPSTFDITEFHWTFDECDCLEDKSLVSYVKELILLFIGISALQLFVKINMSGPGIGDSRNFELCALLLPEEKFSEDECLNFLSANGEFLTTTYQPKLLWAANLLLSANQGSSASLTSHWWRMRLLMIHQRKLPDRIWSMHNEMVSLFDKTVCMDWMENGAHLLPQVMFYIENAQMRLYYHEVVIAHQLIDSACKLVGLEVELGGAYGKRTQFQQKAVAQLVVKLQRNSNISSVPLSSDNDTYFPADLKLNDDVLLNKVSFMNPDESQVEYLLPEEQIVLLGYCSLTRHGGSLDDLVQEEYLCFINYLLEQPKVWPIYLTALIMRCRIEKKMSRRVEHSLMQLEGVIDAIRKEEPSFNVRLPMLYCVDFPTIHSLDKELADIWITVGGTKTALAIYERLGLWEEIVLCYQHLGRMSCAEALVKEQLQKKETPELLCLLGDVTENTALYDKAFELSNRSNARSQRSLGYHHYKCKSYKVCIPYFEKSLEINHLQPSVWFSLGYAAFQCEEYATAARAYRQVVTLDQDNFQAWNNLSSAYIRLQQKERAWRSLHEALKCNYEEWHVWENLLLVSIDIGAFEDVLNCWHRLLDIKTKYQDQEVLNVLVRAINENLLDFSGLPSSRLRKRALQLLGRMSSIIPNDWDIWECYSRLQCPTTAKGETEKEALEKALTYQLKAINCSMGLYPWTDPIVVKRVMDSAIRLAHLFALSVHVDDDSRNRQKSTCRLSVQPVVLRLEKTLTGFDTSKNEEIYHELEENFETLKSLLLEIQNC